MLIVITGHQEIKEYFHLVLEESRLDWENLAQIATRATDGVTMVCVLNVPTRTVTVPSR